MSENPPAGPASLRERLAARAQQWRRRATADEAVEAALTFVAFNKGNQRFGIPVNEVIEVPELKHFSPVPRTPPFIAGVIQWRGEILTLLDLGKLFGIPESGISDVHVSLIVEAAGRRVAVVAHDIQELCSVSISEVKPAPELTAAIPMEWILGVHDENCLILKMDQILQDARIVEWNR